MNYSAFEWVTFGIWIVVIAILTYGIVAIHDIPASIAKKRHHPHADAIEAAGWVSLFMLHALWPFLWIWAMYYKPEDETEKSDKISVLAKEVKQLQERIVFLEKKDNTGTVQHNSGKGAV
jgi:hypothetical protein